MPWRHTILFRCQCFKGHHRKVLVDFRLLCCVSGSNCLLSLVPILTSATCHTASPSWLCGATSQRRQYDQIQKSYDFIGDFVMTFLTNTIYFHKSTLTISTSIFHNIQYEICIFLVVVGQTSASSRRQLVNLFGDIVARINEILAAMTT